MTGRFSRLDFLQFSGLALGGLVVNRMPWMLHQPEPGVTGVLHGRVTIQWIGVYAEPNYHSSLVGSLHRDQIVRLGEHIHSPYGPVGNPWWYHYQDGYVHSAFLQRLQAVHLNQLLVEVPAGGILGEITVPYTQSLRRVGNRWRPLYRLYYGGVFWITGIVKGPDNSAWYALKDDRLNIYYHIPAAHIRPIQPEEMAPLAGEIPPEEKRIRVSLSSQTLTAYEGDRVAFNALIASGPDTPSGKFRVLTKRPSRHMGNGEITTDLEAYELPGVPWVCYFNGAGYAFHGIYWHDSFGSRISHGCINLAPSEALWLYRWTLPTAGPSEWFIAGRGTPIEIGP